MPKCETLSANASLLGPTTRTMGTTRSGRNLRQPSRIRKGGIWPPSSSRGPSPAPPAPGVIDADVGAPAVSPDYAIFEAETEAPTMSSITSQQSATEGNDELTTLRAALARTNRALERQKRTSQKAKEAAGEAHEQLEEAREEVEQLTERLEKAEQDVQQYRNWWLNEVQFTKLILNKVPNRNADWDLVRASQSHYLGRF
ncbi:hypothetical protein BKA70DRAFT_1218104 [Coprinopsis sp. MPI-PUGE-AT-0042]|nr:hypothetical protein BKA70DRAFT_1218104 [Coprinopsis sp. MPI-PUGE-AT-0042]